jgi:heme exporter protein C
MGPKPKALTILDIVSVILFLTAVYLALVYTPLEAVMGWVQKVFYFHVATAWVGMMGFMVAGVAGIIYLWKKDLKWDIVEVAAVEISMVFFGITIVMGSIWARPIWNTWWTWDPRLTTAAITMLVYAAYMMLRQGIEDPDRRARFGAVYTILGFVAVPITFISIRLLRTIHPVVIGEGAGSGDGSFAMSADMRTAFFFSLFVFTVLFIDFMWHRIRMGQLAAKVEQLRLMVSG